MIIGIGPALHVHRQRVARCWGFRGTSWVRSGEYRHIIDETASVVAGELGRHSMDVGKWYFEVVPQLVSGSPFDCAIGLGADDVTNEGTGGTQKLFAMRYNGTFTVSGSGAGQTNGTGFTFASGDVLGVHVDLDNKKFFLAKNNTLPNSQDPVTGANPLFSNWAAQRYTLWAWADNSNGNHRVTWRVPSMFSYAPPAGYHRGWLM